MRLSSSQSDVVDRSRLLQWLAVVTSTFTRNPWTCPPSHPPTHPRHAHSPIHPLIQHPCNDIYFALRTRGLPLECDPSSPKYLSVWSIFDCPNREVNSDPATLAITKLEIEVDTRWGDCACPRSSLSCHQPLPSMRLFRHCAESSTIFFGFFSPRWHRGRGTIQPSPVWRGFGRDLPPWDCRGQSVLTRMCVPPPVSHWI